MWWLKPVELQSLLLLDQLSLLQKKLLAFLWRWTWKELFLQEILSVLIQNFLVRWKTTVWSRNWDWTCTRVTKLFFSAVHFNISIGTHLILVPLGNKSTILKPQSTVKWICHIFKLSLVYSAFRNLVLKSHLKETAR